MFQAINPSNLFTVLLAIAIPYLPALGILSFLMRLLQQCTHFLFPIWLLQLNLRYFFLNSDLLLTYVDAAASWKRERDCLLTYLSTYDKILPEGRASAYHIACLMNDAVSLQISFAIHIELLLITGSSVTDFCKISRFMFSVVVPQMAHFSW